MEKTQNDSSANRPRTRQGKKPRRQRPLARRVRTTTHGSSAHLQPPEAPVFVGEMKRDKIRIDIISYNERTLHEFADISVQELDSLNQPSVVTWINVSGIHDLQVIEAIGKRFGLHPLTVEDIVNTTQRPKAEVFPDYLFIALKMMSSNEASVNVEHVSIILGPNYVISFLEDEGDVFDVVRERLRRTIGRIRTLKSDFLAYSLVDAVVDHYYLVVEQIGSYIDEVDERLSTEARPDDVHLIHRLKREILGLRKAVWPLREEVSAIDKSASTLIQPETHVFLHDLYDHTIQIIDIVENYRELLNGMHDLYLSSVSNRTNEIMKMLTIIATIFIPLTFIAGVYGMNFEHMPELKWPWGYYFIWLVMLVCGGSMVMFFKRKKWL